MANRKSSSAKSRSSRLSTLVRRRKQRRLRELLLENLEARQLLAVGPQLIGIQPNTSDLLTDGSVQTVAPRELVFRFDDAQHIDPSTVSGIRILAAGGDGTFGLNSAESDFGSNGKASILLTASVPGESFTVDVSIADLGPGVSPAISVSGTTVSIALNNNFSTPTTASELVSAINTSPALSGRITARLLGGDPAAVLGQQPASAFAPFSINASHDRQITPGAVLVGDAPNENEVRVRFAETLGDDDYRIEIFGFDDPARGIVGLRNTDGEFFQPSQPGTRSERVDFRLDLGPQVVSVVPQPVVRVGGQLTQLRDTIVVYFNGDKLFVENDSSGNPTPASAEHPEFYQLFYTSNTVRNTDDLRFLPVSVKYNAIDNTATLKFANDIEKLPPVSLPDAAFRLRIGTRESVPIVPRRSDAAANVISDLNTDGAAKVRLTAKEPGESGNGIQVVFTNSGSGTPVVTATGRTIQVDMGRNNLTAQELVDLLNTSSPSAALIDASLEPGSDPNTVVGNRSLSYSPLTLLGMGSTFDTAMQLGVLGSSVQTQSSLILVSSIDPQPFLLDLPGANDDDGHRQLPQNANDFEGHVNDQFGADSTPGITTIYYNFKNQYGTDSSNNPLINSIDEEQKQRARQIVDLWARYIGVQFVETADAGVTIAVGQLAALNPLPGTRVETEPTLGFGARIDPSFENSLIVMAGDEEWDNEYGGDFSRRLAAALGMVLGLEHAGNLPETTLMRLDPTFLSSSGTLLDQNDTQLNANDELYEPVFPGNYDILHGRYLYRPDSNDIDLYRFEVDLGPDRVGLLTAETFAQRLPNSSSLDTNLKLFRRVQAKATTTFGAGNTLQVEFEAKADGPLGNQLRVFFTQTNRSDTSAPGITVFPNAIGVDLNSNPAMLTTVGEVIDAINNHPDASRLVQARLVVGSPAATVGDNFLDVNPVVLTGGSVELVAQNDDYFSNDSLLRQSLGSGVYYLGVSASGNESYNGVVEDGGSGGKSQGAYELRLTFRAAVDTSDAIRDVATSDTPSVIIDGDGDGVPGGVYNFWFETRPLNRMLTISGTGADVDGGLVTIRGANGVERIFEFSVSGLASAPGRVAIPINAADGSGTLASKLAAAINAQTSVGVGAVANGATVTLTGEQRISLSPDLTSIQLHGRTIFVDKSAGPNADGSLQHPFNNINGTGVPNAFAAAHPGDIVRIVGNGGADQNLATVDDNFAYEFGVGLLPGQVLSDGRLMEIPKGVITMIDAGAVFKLRQSAVIAGSTNLNIDRSGAVLQVLGTPFLLDASGNALRDANGNRYAGSVYFTSWLDESIGFDSYAPTTQPSPGDWGGLNLRGDVDADAGRKSRESEGIFLQYINHADVRYGGGSVVIDSVQRTVNPIQMLEVRPTVTDNVVQFSAEAAMSALPNSFRETTFQEPVFQAKGAFTSGYDRVGPVIQRNKLINNSLNGLFIRVQTPVTGTTESLTVPGRLDDIDIVHLVTENLIVSGRAGGPLLDATTPSISTVSSAPAAGGTLLPGTYNYKLTYVDADGYESVPSDPTLNITLLPGQTAVSIAGLPAATGDFVRRKLYRSQPDGKGPYVLIGELDRASSTFFDNGTDVGGTLSRDRLDVRDVTLTQVAGGSLNGTYNYRLVMYDAAGREGLASQPTADISVPAGSQIQLANLPTTLPGYIGRRIYRSSDTGQGPYVLVAELPDSTSSTVTSLVDNGSDLGQTLSAETLAVKRPRLDASLVIDPGTVIKLEASRIEATADATILAEGTDGLPIVFTSRMDDTIGAGGTFDTNNDGTATSPAPRDWGGIYMAPTSSLSVDHARFAYAGGVTRIEGTFRAFNTIEIQQADARIANSTFENNADGFGGQGPGTRFGRLSNAPATIFVRGAQPAIIGNTFVDNVGPAIEIDVNSMSDDLMGDPGRQTGAANRNEAFDTNRGPLFRENRMDNNGLNGLKIRGRAILTTASVWDDTDIVHVVTNEIFVSNLEHEGGLRLQSAPNESLVVKFDGRGSDFNRYIGAGISAIGDRSTGRDRVGGTVHILGQPGFPVILTSLKDDTVGAGLKPDGSPQTDTNNDGIDSIPQAGDWRGILLDQYSNDRNVGITLELESPTAAPPGQNSTTVNAQFLGDLAGEMKESSENLRLGFTVVGSLSAPGDIDVYSFTGVAGSIVWLDVDATDPSSDMVLELLDANGNLLARSDNSTAEADNPGLLFTTSLIPGDAVNPLPLNPALTRRTSSGAVKETGTTNPRDPGMRVRLPGNTGTRSTYFFRVRSAGKDISDPAGGLSDGVYEAQIRLREAQEFPGSTITYADIRYATDGIRLVGLPSTSPLMGEVAEDESVSASAPGSGQVFADNGTAIGDGIAWNYNGPASVEKMVGRRPQYIGNILDTALGGISVAGTISNVQDVDFYMFEISQEDVVDSLDGYVPIVIDVDYADGFNRPDTSINIFQEEPSSRFSGERQYRLIYSGDASNIAEDQPRPLEVTDQADLSRGSAGKKDPYIGPIALAPGRYLIGISSAAYQPRAKLLNPFNSEPIQSIRRIVDTGYVPGVTTADPPVVTSFLPSSSLGGSGEIVSAPFSLASYSAADLPAVYMDYTLSTGSFDVYVRDASGTETLIATSGGGSLPQLVPGTNSIKIPLADSAAGFNFAGQDNLRLVFRGSDASTTIDRLIIGFAERGERITSSDDPILLAGAFLGQNDNEFTRVFNLRTYDPVVDDPDLVFNYFVQSGNLDVFVNVGGIRIRVATTDANNAGPGEVVLSTGSPQVGVIDLSPWADPNPFGLPDPPDIQIEFATRNDNPTAVTVSNVFVRLADGSRVMSNEPNSTYGRTAVPPSTITTGDYQFEVRLAETFFQSQPFGGITLTRSWDTNDRLADQISIVAPDGSAITDGDKFAISDGGKELVFEFDSGGGVGLGNIAISYDAADPAHVIARKIRDVINSSAVQSQLQVRAASSGGIASGDAGQDATLNLFGLASVRTVSVANPAGQVQVIQHTGWSDRNIERVQSQVIIQNNSIRESEGYGIWSQPAERIQDPRDLEAINGELGPFGRTIIQDKPPLVGTQAVRNLPTKNDAVDGGIVPGVVIRNNLLEEGGLGGIKIDGESPIWMISPNFLPSTDNDPTVNSDGAHFGWYIDDGDTFVIDSDRLRLEFEFEDITQQVAGPSGNVHGDGVSSDAVPVYYREEGGDFYHRINVNPFVAFATNGLETLHAMRDAILGSIFVTNGTTQQVRATIAESLLGPDPFAPSTSQTQFYPEYYNRPALYLEGVTNIQLFSTRDPFEYRPLDLGEAPQPHARIVNNTIIGKDGRASFNGEEGTQEPNDTIQDAVQTWQGTSHNPLTYTSTGVIGDGGPIVPFGQGALSGGAAGSVFTADVDMYQFKLGTGERAIIDIDIPAGSSLDAVLRIFDAQGNPQAFHNSLGELVTISDNDPAPGESPSLEPYADFTALKPGVYYAAVSAKGNEDYNPLSLAGRRSATTQGDYQISISARHLQEFVITAQDASAYNNGDTFTIYGVPDIPGLGTAGRTFEFVIGGGGPSNPNNIPININADWRAPDVARAIAKAINEGDNGNPAISNVQNLPNGDKGTANPLPPVHAVPLGGLNGVLDASYNNLVGDRATILNQFVDWNTNLVAGLGFNKVPDRELERLLGSSFWEVNQGLELFARRRDGNVFSRSASFGGVVHTISTSMGNLGIGHDIDETRPLSRTSVGDGTTEKFVVVKNAAYIDSGGSILVDPDANGNDNLDQLLPETGVLASRGASPTILNNVFFNVQTPVVAEESRRFTLTGAPAPYGSDNPNRVLKPGEVVLGGSIFQYYETATTNVRFGTGIEQSPTNVPNTSLDFNFDIPAGTRLFVNAQAGNYLPAANSPLVDSSIDVLPDRPSIAAVRTSVDIPLSPVLAPTHDLAGQLRIDDPNVAPPSGQGTNVFKDRGALERADGVGPAAILLRPVDNDAQGADLDPSVSVVQLRSGTLSEFRIQLSDGNNPTNPFFGLGVDDNTVTSAPDGNRRTEGANIVLFENGRMLAEGIDYTFSYNPTRDEIVLTPLAGVWKPNAVYEISVNNRDRFALIAPSGAAVQDGDTFTVIDSDGGQVVFEYESGYQLQVPQSLNLLIPLAGGSFGGVTDGDRLTITAGAQSVTFEFDFNNNVVAGNTRVPFLPGASQEDIADALIAAIQGSVLPVTASKQAPGIVFVGAAAGVRVSTTNSAIDQPVTTLALQMPALGPRPGGITDGQQFTISDGSRSVLFEYDTDGNVGAGAVAIDISTALTVQDLTDATFAALQSSPLAITPQVVAPDLVYIGLSSEGSVSTGTSNLEVVGVSRTPGAGETFTIVASGNSATFEFTHTGAVSPGNVPVVIQPDDDTDTIAGQIVSAIASSGIGLSPVRIPGEGTIILGGVEGDVVDITGAPSLGVEGAPGVTSNTQMRISGPVILSVPTRGAGDITDGSTFTIAANGQVVTFEFDSDGSGPSAPGNVVVVFDLLSTRNDIAAAIVSAINGSSLGITAVNLGNGRVSIGNVPPANVNLGNSNLSLSQAAAGDGETFTITNGATSVTFELEDVDSNNGFNAANTPILFSFSTDTSDTLAQSIKAAVESAGLDLTVQVEPGGLLLFDAKPTHQFDVSGAPSLSISGVPGGAQPIQFIHSPSFSGEDMKQAILAAINNTPHTSLIARDRGGDTLFVENAVTVSTDIGSFFLRGVADVAGNNLQPNRINNETQFTILMPGVDLDYGDAPDPVQSTPGRYPTRHVNDGARHVINGEAILGSSITAEIDGQPTAAADGDVDDGVVFGTNLNTVGAFNPHVFTSIEITLSSPGYVDAWIDFNADGDWDDPGEQILSSVRFDSSRLTRTFLVTVPSTTPMPSVPTTTYARFRSSTTGGLTPTGLGVGGEVEDYTVTLVPGTPPTAVDDSYTINEDTTLTTTDPDGTLTPGFTIDDGLAANDTDPDGDPLRVQIVDPPAVGTLTLTNPSDPDGTFTYQPPANFNGTVTFTYRVNDGSLNSNNLGTVTITVLEVNDPPIANDDNLEIDEDEQLDIDQSVLTGNDQPGPGNTEDDQTLTVVSVDSVSQQGGTVTLAGGRIIYTPPRDYSGPDQFTYTVSDNGTTAGMPAPLSATATVFLNIRDKNDPPIAGGDSLTTAEDTPVSVNVATLLANDSPGPANESGQLVSFVDVAPASAAGGTVVASGGIVTYTPPPDFTGTDEFTYTIVDDGTSGGQPDPQQSVGTVTVTVTPVNDAPRVASPFGEVQMDEDDPALVIDLNSVFVDPDVATDGDVLTFTILSNSNATLVQPVINGSQLELQLGADQNGQALIVVRAEDQAGESITDTLTLTVNPVNDAPRLVQALPDITVNEDAPPVQVVLTPTYFFDPDVALNGDQLTFNVISNSNPVLVTPSISGDTLILNLATNQSGVAVITVSATDLAGQTISDTMNLVVNPVNDPPVTNPDTYSVQQGETLTTTDPRGLVGDASDDGVLANDSDPEGDQLTALLVDPPQFASLFQLNADGTFTYRHDFTRGRTTDSFTYRAVDSQGAASMVTTVTITIDPPPPPPHQNPANALDVNADGFISPIDALLIINLLNNTGGGPVSGLPSPPPYRDVNGDNFITPIDALIVINALNSSVGGEGEADWRTLGAAAASTQVVVQNTGDNQPLHMVSIEEGRSGSSEQSVVDPLLGQFDDVQEPWMVESDWVTDRVRPDRAEEDMEASIDVALADMLGNADDES